MRGSRRRKWPRKCKFQGILTEISNSIPKGLLLSRPSKSQKSLAWISILFFLAETLQNVEKKGEVEIKVTFINAPDPRRYIKALARIYEQRLGCEIEK